jgi:uncharacterized protein (TIGR03067 family)
MKAKSTVSFVFALTVALLAGHAARAADTLKQVPEAEGKKPGKVVPDKVPPGKVADANGKEGVTDLEGEWKVVGVEREGKKAGIRAVKVSRIVIKGDEISFSPGAEPFKTRIKLDRGKTPPTIDLIPLGGPQKGKPVSSGIFSLKKGQLTLCISDGPSAERPTEFKTKAGDGLALVTFERVDAAGEPLRVRT